MPTDQEISALVASGQHDQARDRMQFRQMQAADDQAATSARIAAALESIAESLVKLANPPVIMAQAASQLGQLQAASQLGQLQAEQVALRPDAPVLGEPDPFDAA